MQRCVGFLVAAACGASWPVAAAPSFDCTKATLPVERIICSDPNLSAADRRMATLYSEARREARANTATLIEEQRLFLKDREDCLEDDDEHRIACLSQRYEIRSRTLFATLPIIEQLRQPVSAATADRLIPLFHLMTPEDLNEAASAENREALSEASCRFFRRFPQEAAALMGPFFYSTQDSWTPLCRGLDVAEQVPSTRALLRLLEVIEGAQAIPICTGTMQYGTVRAQMVARLLAVVEAHPDYAREGRDRRQRATDEMRMGYHPDLEHWSEQGLWERRQYAVFQRLSAQTRPALAAEYVRRFKLGTAEADRLAAYHVRRMVDAYTGQTGESSTRAYASLCLSLADLDGYLDRGKLPTRLCPEADLFESGSGATLRRLLGLAIVNDYPLAVVRRLLAAGAALNPAPPTLTFESRESLLMLAAARADVIAVLLGAGADATLGNRFGKTALMYAVQERNLAGVSSLLRAGVDVNAATAGKISFEDPTRASCSLEAGGRTALMYAAWHGTPEIVRLLLAAHADLNRKDSEGKTAAAYVAANQVLSPADRQLMKSLLDAAPGHRGDAQDTAQRRRPRRLDVYLRRHRVQPRPNAQSAGGNVTSQWPWRLIN
jgi:uncharacterized protein